MEFSAFLILDPTLYLSQVKGVVGDLEYPESGLTESTQILSQESSDENDEENEEHCLEAAVVFKQIEAKPPVQFGLNNENLDLIYSGYQQWAYALALHKLTFGNDEVAYEMLPKNRPVAFQRVFAAET